MDCCGEYRAPAHGQYAGAPPWEYGAYAPLPYAPYAHYYQPHAHDPYRYYRHDYPAPAHHAHPTDHVGHMDYSAYASKEGRVRRALARRDARALTPSHHLPLPPTPPLECGMNGRGSVYGETQMWPHYQMGLGSGWSGVNSGWMSRGSCAREHMHYPPDFRPVKGPHLHGHNQVVPQDGRSPPYHVYEESSYGGENGVRHRNTPEFHASGVPAPAAEPARTPRERPCVEPRLSPPKEKRPPVVPLPAFQQAFGSTEIGKFAEAFSRAEVAVEDDNFAFDAFPEWDGPTEPQWSSPPATREIKCEDNY